MKFVSGPFDGKDVGSTPEVGDVGNYPSRMKIGTRWASVSNYYRNNGHNLVWEAMIVDEWKPGMEANPDE